MFAGHGRKGGVLLGSTHHRLQDALARSGDAPSCHDGGADDDSRYNATAPGRVAVTTSHEIGAVWKRTPYVPQCLSGHYRTSARTYLGGSLDVLSVMYGVEPPVEVRQAVRASVPREERDVVDGYRPDYLRCQS